MLANPRAPWQIQVSPVVKFVILGLFAAAVAYFVVFASPPEVPTAPEPDVEITVSVPQLDAAIVAQAKDSTREQRLVVEAEPLRHMLEKALDVSPAAALALGMPDEPLPIDDVRHRRNELRGSWIWYKGVLEELSAGRDGHPVKGFKIYEATVRLADGERAMATFSLPPPAEAKKGGVVRIEGFLLKVRDTNYPHDIREAPMLVGRQIQLDFADWAPVTELDPALLAEVDDTDRSYGSLMWRDVEEDQSPPLWHLAAYARDSAPRTFEEWRREPVLNVADVYDKLIAGKIERGTPMRILGTLVKRRSIVAPPNPAGIAHWTVAYLQVRDFAGYVIPVWVPERLLDVPLRTDLEVRGYYYRWFAYESIENVRLRVPLFVANGLDRFDLKVGATMNTLGMVVATALVVLVLIVVLTQRRAKRQAEQHSRDMDERRRRRRERTLAQATEDAPPATS